MFSYLALLWNPRSTEEQANSKNLKTRIFEKHADFYCCLSTSGMSVHCQKSKDSDGTALLLPERRGVILGTAFPTATTSKPSPPHIAAQTELSLLDSAEIISTTGSIITEKLWGSYISLFTTPDFRVRYVLRSPCSILSCFHTVIDNVQVFFSVVDDCLQLRQAPFTVHWPVIRAQTAQRDYLTRETALAEVKDIEPGELVTHREDSLTKSFLWNPCKISRERPIERFADAVESIRTETLRVVHGWASLYNDIVLQLSGGLDSSVVLASLKDAPTAPRIYPVTLYSIDECLADERAYARSMANKAGIPLITLERANDCDLSIFLRCSRTARPVLNFTAPSYVFALKNLVTAHKCDAVFDGELGDQVFGSPATSEPVADFLFRRGMHPMIFMVARDLARARRISVWLALRDGIFLYRSSNWRSSRAEMTDYIRPFDLARTSFVTRDVLEQCLRETKRFIHPWFHDGYTTAPSTLPLIYALIITTSTSYHAPFRIPNDPPYVRPLISQPLIEAALRIPGELSIRRGWNRSVVRTAFSRHLSKEVLLRTTKISFDTWCRLAIRKNALWLKEFFLDGILAKERLLDTKRVEILLSNKMTADSALIPHLFAVAYIEGWLRQYIS